MNTRLVQTFTDALCQEISGMKSYLGADEIETIYFGGGTPSVLNENQLSQIFEVLYRTFTIVPDAEVTLEANPDDINASYVTMLQKSEVNRVSMGVQSFDDDDLKFMNRRHNAAQGIKAVDLILNAGISNVTIDLIYGLPNQTPKKWLQNLDKALALPITHLSCYHLMYEEGTLIHRLKKQKKITPVIEKISNKMFELLIEETGKHGFDHYEISNFAKPGYYSKHNSSYWTGKKYLGLGPSAHSYNGNSRQWNKKGVKVYMDAMESGTIFWEGENLSPKDQFNEYVITRLRTIWGCDLHEMKQKFGRELFGEFEKNLIRWVRTGHLKEKQGVITLAREGIMISDAILADVIL